MRVSIILIGFGLVLGLPTSASALDPGVKCEADKLKETGKYGFCRLKAESKGLKKGEAPDFAKCVSKFTGKWPTIEAKAEGACPTNNDQAAMDSEITSHVDRMAVLLSGGEPGSPCPATGQVSCWDPNGTLITCAGTGHDGEIQAGATLAYMDNGDGTITDLNTGLMWEKKSDDDSIHDKDTTYTWADAFAVHVAGLNSAVFAGHTDWRVPNVKELQSIIDYETFGPSLDPVFNASCVVSCDVLSCSCTAPAVYWSSASYAANPSTAWKMSFFNGDLSFTGSKAEVRRVQAVRGGL